MVPFNTATRAQALGLKVAGLENAQIEDFTGIKPRTLRNLYQRALHRDFDPDTRPCQILDKHVEDAPRSGRPSTNPVKKK
ncbi:hypothetical protein EJ08DRAFT_588915 [Tothia fuscella]|uniref:Uncharacterized protein n=1 Tax=Tothia fuscella TaxID=1048955 RepID=A0A9P4TYP0_9PEZI|nr:hypothetical protein EJ08DRAFT_588915 [Tothia fuscella]